MATQYLEIVSHDAAALTALYERLHGLVFGPPDPDLGQARVATQADGTLVGIREPLAAHEQPIMRTYLEVEDIHRAVAAAGESGAVVAYAPTRQGARGTFAIVIQGGVQHGLWQPAQARPRATAPREPRPSVVVFVSDVARVAAFYRALADMVEAHADEDHVVLEVGGLELVIHRLSNEPSPVRDTAGRPHVREDSYLKLCLPVASIAAARAAAARFGGDVRGTQCEWEGRGFRACDGHDPEGNVIQVRERAAGDR